MMGMPGLEKETMRAGSIAASMCLCLTLLTACAFTKRFEPTTTDERAIVDTIASFLAAYRAQDYATIGALTTPEATLRADNGNPQNLREGIVALRTDETASALLQVTPKTLVNFQHPSSDSASVESYVHVAQDRGFDNAQIKWELARREQQWLILAMTTDSWTVNLHSQGGGP
jgi:ketosteroid isomerase-like protein